LTNTAFEPFSINSHNLKKNIKQNNFENIEIVEKIVGDKNTQLNIYYAGEDNPGKTSCVADINKDIVEKVESITLDSFIENKNIKVDMLKIDVEGYELNVLKGMKRILEGQFPIVFVEHNSSTLASNHNKIDDLIGFMTSLNYKVYDISSQNMIPYLGGDRSLVLYCHTSVEKEILGLYE
jgi:FkbM family methyltransferase